MKLNITLAISWIAKAHDREGRPQALPSGFEAMQQQVASGLWSSARDMGEFLSAVLQKSDFLSQWIWELMLSRAPKSWLGLGPRLNGSGEMAVFHHGGSNNSYQAWFEGQPGAQDGLVVLTNAAGGRILAHEYRKAIERALGWRLRPPDDYDEPTAL